MVAAMVTVTPERERMVAFSESTRTNVSEVVVTGPGASPIVTLDDLSGQDVFVRKGSIYQPSAGATRSGEGAGREGPVKMDAERAEATSVAGRRHAADYVTPGASATAMTHVGGNRESSFEKPA